MEVRSSRRMRMLVTQMAHRGLSANENAGALIAMMAWSMASNSRPDTLMQDRPPPARRNLLATHGRTIHWGQSLPGRASSNSGHVRYAPKAEESSRSAICLCGFDGDAHDVISWQHLLKRGAVPRQEI